MPKKEELEELYRNINSKIIRRGRFMMAMLEISMKYPDVYTRIMQEVFMAEQAYEGYGEVIEVIREKIPPCAADVYEAVDVLLNGLAELENETLVGKYQSFKGANPDCDADTSI